MIHDTLKSALQNAVRCGLSDSEVLAGILRGLQGEAVRKLERIRRRQK